MSNAHWYFTNGPEQKKEDAFIQPHTQSKTIEDVIAY